MILLETILYSLADLAILLFSYIFVGILVFSGIQGILKYMRKDSDTCLILGKGIATALEFLLGSSVLRILTDPTFISALTALIILIILAGLCVLLYLAEKHNAAATNDQTAASEESERE